MGTLAVEQAAAVNSATVESEGPEPAVPLRAKTVPVPEKGLGLV